MKKRERLKRIVCFFLAINLLFEVISPSVALALTSGPAQQEFSSFEPSATTDMVDLSSGDFTYNIPLMSVPGPNGGYPINVAYHSGIGMEQEASWVGLGWSLNVGSINRQLRGIPDDFNGDQVKKRQHSKESWMVALDIPKKVYREVVGFPPPSASGLLGSSTHIQVYYNNYKGLGYRYSANFTFPNKGIGEHASIGLNASFDSQNGIEMEPKLSLNASRKSSRYKAGFEAGFSFNSLQGIHKYNFSYSLSRSGNKGVDRDGIKTGDLKYTRTYAAHISYAANMNMPTLNVPTKVTTVPFNLKIAKPNKMKMPGKFQSKFPLLWSGYVTTNKLENDGKMTLNSYGYLNNHVTSSDDVLRDFQRGEIAYSKKTPNLSSSAFTYDIYNQTGQGTGSMFRAYQNQVNVLYDPKIVSTESSYDTELEFGLGPAFVVPFNTFNLHVGVGFNYGSGENKSGNWETIGSNSDVSNTFNALVLGTSSPTSKFHEKSYFKIHGEKTGFYSQSADDQLYSYAGDKAIRFDLEKVNNDANFLNRQYILKDELIENEGQSAVANLSVNNPYRNQNTREKRSNNIEHLTTAQAQAFGYSRFVSYDVNGSPVNKFPSSKPSHHLSEISMLQNDGMRYVYGIPTYNTKQVDNVFTVKNSVLANNFNTNTVSISPGSIEGIDISGTQEEYMSRNELPQYANNYLLTYIFSADYVDLTNDGPTNDDYGYWVKFNYEKVHDNYKWRAPYAGANFNQGLKSATYDDKGTYTYGEKEIFIIKSIESKTHIAKFITSNRRDGLEADGELSNTGPNASTAKKSRKLDKITLYSKKDLVTPVKTANFVYSYELCKGVLNNLGGSDISPNDYYDQTGTLIQGQDINAGNLGGGKLTLKQIYFTYKNSKKSQLSPYIFNYNTPNPNYDRRNMDRWGNYANNVGGSFPAYLYGNGQPSSTNQYPYVDFPYTNQDSPNLTPIAPWTLSQIALPTGGVMNIEYENDDYHYVEGEKALRMYDITGIDVNNVNSTRIAANIYTANADKHRIYFKLEKPYNTANFNNLATFMEEYINQLPKGQVYFKVHARMYNYSQDPSVYDYVSGYGEVDPANCGLDNPVGNNIYYGYIQLKKVGLSKNNVSGTQISPIVKSIIEHMRLNRSELLYNSVPNSNSVPAQIANLLSSTFTLFSQIKAAVVGFNHYMYNSKYNKNFDIQTNGRSIIRLCDPDDKIGGGVRVKRLAISDNWVNGATAQNSDYGQVYEYKTTDANGKVISSGVSYEPQIGYEECSLRTAIKFASSSWTHSDYPTFVETPVASMHYPGESVGYSKVTVRSIGSENAAGATNNANILKSNAAPITVYEFYTQKDFPVIFKQTDNGPYAKPIYVPIPILGLFSTIKRRHAKSQGYSVVLNDMAGKQKQITSYTAKNTVVLGNLVSVPDKIISMKKFIYNTNNPYNPNAVNELNSKVQTIKVNGSYNTEYQTAILGQSHDMYVDMNENSQFHEAFGATGNLDLAMFVVPPAVPAPIIIPWVLPSYHRTTNSMRTVVYNKIIHRSGILIKTETTSDKSTIAEENLAFDIESGAPLLTKVTNEFKDPIYSFNFPAHWYYNNLGGAYKNFGLKFNYPPNTFFSNSLTGIIQMPNAQSYFTKGDLVYIDASANNVADGLYHVYTLNNSSLHCVNANGNYFLPNTAITSIEIVRSGFKNQQTVNVGNIAFKQTGFVPYNPAVPGSEIFSPSSIAFDNASSNKIINASAIEISDNWQIACANDPGLVNEPGGCNCTPTPGAFDLVNFLNGLAAVNKLYNINELVFTNGTPAGNLYNNSYPGTYLYGFTQNLILNNPSLKFDLSQTPPANQVSNGGSVNYTGGISPNDNSFMFFLKSGFSFQNTNPETNCNGNPRTCAYKFMPPASVTNNFQQFWSAFFVSSISVLNSNSCDQSGLNLSANVPGYGQVEVSAYTTPCNPAYIAYSCPSFYNCTPANPNAPGSCANTVGSILNPYQKGMKGIWRPKYMYAFKTDRTQNNNIREDGVYTSFTRFPWENPPTKNAAWIKSNTVTKYNPEGFEVENVNPIGNFSSALYGYENALVTALASNARYTDIAFDGFEDYPRACVQDHFSFNQFSSNVTNTEAHTGKYSIQVANQIPVSTNRKVFTNCDPNTVGGVPFVNDNPAAPNTVGNQHVSHVVKPCDCIGKFAPQLTKKYLVSAWIKEKLNVSATKPLDNYAGTTIQLTFYNGNSVISTVNFTPSGNIIDGWQRLMGEFTLPNNTTEIKVTMLYNTTALTTSAFVDDIRLMPFDGNMKTFVYDAKSSKVLAELDENNYATIYNYDEEDNLTKVKKETEKGIKTVKEGRINPKKLTN